MNFEIRFSKFIGLLLTIAVTHVSKKLYPFKLLLVTYFDGIMLLQ